MTNTYQLLAVIKASIKASGSCAVPFFALNEIFPTIREAEMGEAGLPKNICERIRSLCSTEHLLCQYDHKKKVVVFQDANWTASAFSDTYSKGFTEHARAKSA